MAPCTTLPGVIADLTCGRRVLRKGRENSTWVLIGRSERPGRSGSDGLVREPLLRVPLRTYSENAPRLVDVKWNIGSRPGTLVTDQTGDTGDTFRQHRRPRRDARCPGPGPTGCPNA